MFSATMRLDDSLVDKTRLVGFVESILVVRDEHTQTIEYTYTSITFTLFSHDTGLQ